MKKIIEFFNSPKISRMGEYMLTGRYIMVLFTLASVFVIFDISVAGVLTFACITGITLVLCEDLLAPFPPFLFLCLIGTKCYNSFSVFIQYKALCGTDNLCNYALCFALEEAGAERIPHAADDICVCCGNARRSRFHLET